MNRIFDIRKHSPRQNESLFTKESDFRGTESQKLQIDKFVTVGVPEAETNANLIIFAF